MISILSEKNYQTYWVYLIKKIAYPYGNFNIIGDYQKPVINFKKQDFFSKLENACPCDEKIECTKNFLKFLVVIMV